MGIKFSIQPGDLLTAALKWLWSCAVSLLDPPCCKGPCCSLSSPLLPRRIYGCHSRNICASLPALMWWHWKLPINNFRYHSNVKSFWWNFPHRWYRKTCERNVLSYFLKYSVFCCHQLPRVEINLLATRQVEYIYSTSILTCWLFNKKLKICLAAVFPPSQLCLQLTPV